MRTTSWVIVETATGKAIAETFNRDIAEVVNTPKYKAVPILEYLTALNRAIASAAAR